MELLLQWFSEPFAYPFMQRAIIAAIVTGVVCAVLSCYLVLKGWSLMGMPFLTPCFPALCWPLCSAFHWRLAHFFPAFSARSRRAI